jgi:hypothetical protein
VFYQLRLVRTKDRQYQISSELLKYHLFILDQYTQRSIFILKLQEIKNIKLNTASLKNILPLVWLLLGPELDNSPPHIVGFVIQGYSYISVQ